MKKRLLALLLAGLITASLASCNKDDPIVNPNEGTGTEDSQTRPDNTQTDPPTVVTWDVVDEYVYVITDNLTLTGVEDNKTTTAKLMDKLHRVKISTTKSIVELDGKQYYATNQSLSTEDLTGEKFTPCTETTMYANDSVRIRKYASTDNFSESIGKLDLNDEVIVIAKGTVGSITWCKIKYTEKDGSTSNYFVSAKYLSDKKAGAEDEADYSKYFTDCTPTTMYVTVDTSINVRKNASLASSSAGVLLDGAEVTVIATGTVGDITWSKIKFPDKVQEGQTQTYSIGYLNSKYLTPGTASTVDGMIEKYPAFTKKETVQTMYVSAEQLNVRSTPRFPGENEKTNIVDGLKKKDAVKVVATALIDGTNWAMIEFQEGVFYFVGASQLTTDPDGNPTPATPEELIAQYKFTACTEKVVVAKGVVNCNTAPTNQTNVSKKLAKGDKVTVLATGEADGTTWYLFQVEGSTMCYFAGADMFEDVTE